MPQGSTNNLRSKSSRETDYCSSKVRSFLGRFKVFNLFLRRWTQPRQSSCLNLLNAGITSLNHLARVRHKTTSLHVSSTVRMLRDLLLFNHTVRHRVYRASWTWLKERLLETPNLHSKVMLLWIYSWCHHLQITLLRGFLCPNTCNPLPVCPDMEFSAVVLIEFGMEDIWNCHFKEPKLW